MNNRDRAVGPAKSSRKAIMLVTVMLLASLGPILSSPLVGAHEGVNGVIWPKEGAEDTGWVLLNATGANSINGTQASADWMLNFAPGAILENVSLEMRVDGSDGVSIQQPLLMAPDTGQVLFDWRGNGWLGQSFGFDSSNPHQGRLGPNADVGATVTLPSSSEITDFVLEVLAPADPFTSLEPVELYIQDFEIHPVDGRMYMAIGSYIIILDAQSSPNAIDLFEIENTADENYVTDLEMDVANNRMLITTATGILHSVDLDDTSWNPDLPVEPSGGAWSQVHVASNGDLFALSESGIFTLNTAGTGWTLEQASSTSNWPAGTPWKAFEHNGILYVSLLDGGVGRWDVSSMSPLSPWSTANNLHSDFISDFAVAGNQLLISSFDAGIARRDLSNNFWLATWNDGNWLSTNEVRGLTVVNNEIQILTRDTVHIYNTNSGTFSSSIPLTDLGLINDARNILHWPNSGVRSPTNDIVMVTDGSAVLAMLEPGSTPLYTGDFVIGSSPSSGDMEDAMQFNGVIYVGSENYLDRYSISQSRWLSSIDMGDSVSQIVNDGTNVLVATMGSGIHVVDTLGNVIDTWDSSDGLQSDEVSGIDVEGDWVVAIHPQSGASAFNKSATGSVVSLNEANSDLDSDNPTGVAIHNGIAYIGTPDNGLNRYIIANDTFLGSWVSTGINDVDFAPVAIYGTNPQILHMGLPGYGIARKDLSTGEILIPLTVTPDRGTPSATEILPSNQVFALEENTATGGLYIGTGNGAVVWNGNTATSLSRGNGWNLQPSQHFDFVFDGSTVYSATNIGVCKYAQTSIQDCLNAQDGMPNWGVYAIGMNASTVFGGTSSGVGLIEKSSFTVTDTWEAGEETDNALVEVIDDIAYIGLDGIGVARYDIQNNEWLTTWTQNNVLDSGNEDVTGLVADFRPGQIWVGGGDGFQLLNVTTGAEVYDIEKTSSLYSGSGDPYDMVIHGDTLYYHQQFTSDSVYRIDIANFSVKSALDAGQQVDENGGDVYGLEIIGDVLHVSVASGQWWNTQGSGGIALYNLSTDSWQSELLPSGAVNRVTSHISSNGIEWISWGEEKLEAFYANGTKVGEWDTFEFPIREIVEYDGATLFATEDGVARYNESSGQWLSTWTAGSGLPNSADDVVYELWTNGTDLVVGTARTQGWQGVDGEIMHLDSGGVWTSWDGGSNGIPNGYPIGMEMCGGLFHVTMTANNGGVARFDLANGTIESSFTTSNRLDDGNAAAVACDDANEILYVAYHDDGEPISRYDYTNDQWLTSLTSSTHNIPSDPVWWGAMQFAGGKLAIGYDIGDQGDNVIGGGLAVLSANGATVGNAGHLSTGSPVSSIDWLGTQWLIGQAGGTSGYSHVDTLGQAGQNTIHALPNLVSGQVTSMAGNQTHLWVASASWQNTGSGVLQGIRLPNGSVEWQKGWTIPANAAVTDIELVGTDLYLASNNRGLRLLDTVTGTLQPLPTGIHNFQDGLKVVGSDLFIGLQGSGTSSAGIQVFNTTTNTYTAGRLLAGLPSNNINGFLTVSSNLTGQDMVYIATNNGVARWNASGNNWETAWTALDGLPISFVQDIVEYDNDIWMATPSGLSQYDTTTMSFTNYGTANGLMGTSTWGLIGKTTTTTSSSGVTITQNSLFISHDGKGTDRPGITQFETSTQSVIAQHQFDQLPSNTVTAVTADIWGVHIATDTGPLVNWIRSSGQFNTGPNVFTMQDWPVYSMRSDGTYLIAIGENGATVIQNGATGSSVVGRYSASETSGGSVVTNSFVTISTSNGLRVWDLNSGNEVSSISMRKADPLSVGFQMQFQDITNYTHPGMQVSIIDAANAVTLSSDGTPGAHGILMQTAPLTFSSPVDGAATWAKLVDLKWNATLNLSNDPTFATSMQYAVDNGILLNGTRHVQLTVTSPTNGSMWVRLSYDWFRTETPVQGLSLWDRPDDGGQTLVANWTLVHDDDFARYLVYLNEGPWTTQPTAADLQPRAPDASVSLHSRLQTDVSSIDGQPLQDGVDYWAVVVVEYNDGRFGTPSAPFGSASPSDEVPAPPAWASALSGDGVVAVDGEVYAEWARCQALDLASTRVYASTTEISDALGMDVHTEFMPQVGNVSIITLEAGKPHWLAFTCVDEAGQEDLVNATVIGPIVPTGGIDDGVPPPKLTGVWAEDVPNDDGGRVQMGWDNSIADDCAYVTVYMMPVDIEGGSFQPSNVDGFEVATIVPDCETNMTIIDSIGEDSLIDGQTYWIGAVAFDKWLNGDTGDVTVLEVTPFVNNIDGTTEPDRINELSAWDHPDDDGTAIDISWTPSEADDFDYYVIWVSEHPLDDLTDFWQIAGTEPGICGCIVMDKQWIDTAKSPLELTLNTALYGGNDLASSLPKQIMPDVQLYVAITVHDIKGNVHLDNLNTAMVTPIDNLADDNPPDRLGSLNLYDRPGDDGTAVLLEFDLSEASDVAYYEVYAAAFTFTSVGPSGTVKTPIATLDRSPMLPLTIDILAFDAPVVPNTPVTVAVVPVDWSGNAHLDNLITATAIAIDDGIDDVGAYLPDINGISLEWLDDSILVSWDHTTDPGVRSYMVFISDNEFSNVADATNVGTVSTSNTFLITPDSFTPLRNDSAWWIGISAKDDMNNRKVIDSERIGPIDASGGPGDSGTDKEDSATDLGELLTTENMILAGMILISLFLLILVLRGRGGRPPRNKDWELQEATWGIEARSGWDDVGSFGGQVAAPVAPPPAIQPAQQNDIYAAAQRIQQPSQQTQQPQRWSQPTQQQQPPQGGIDTSFLDDLL